MVSSTAADGARMKGGGAGMLVGVGVEVVLAVGSMRGVLRYVFPLSQR
jgi:hypothetical protein